MLSSESFTCRVLVINLCEIVLASLTEYSSLEPLDCQSNFQA
uniref:Uncharacterized protein n=1 Tax=Anguilla anguilla TaxID=7936 RepID=A0A0E9PAP8_ANGAN